jgi:hypothetical protein
MMLFLRVARRIFPNDIVVAVFMAAAADYQEELRHAEGRAAAFVVRCRWTCAFAVLLLITPLSLPPSAARRLPARLASGGAMLTLLCACLFAGAWGSVAEFMLPAFVAGAFLAWAMRAWNDRHHESSFEPAATSLPSVVQINFSSTRVPGDIAGLIFAVGTILIVVVGLPGWWWFFLAAAAGSGLLAWHRIERESETERVTQLHVDIG